MWIKLLFLFTPILTFSATPAPSPVATPAPTPVVQVFKGALYGLDDVDLKTPLYTVERRKATLGAQADVTTHYRTPTGEDAFVEKLKYSNGKVVHYLYDQLQCKEKVELKVTEKTFEFHLVNPKENEQESENIRNPWMVADQLADIVQDNWELLQKGETLSMRFVAMERIETVGFDFKKIPDPRPGLNKRTVIQMKPSSIIIALLVTPILLYFEQEAPHSILEVKGRMPIKQWDGSKWAAVEARFVFFTNGSKP